MHRSSFHRPRSISFSVGPFSVSTYLYLSGVVRGVGVTIMGALVVCIIVTVCSSEVVDAEVDSLGMLAIQRLYNTVHMTVGEYI